MVKLTDHDSLSGETVRRRLAENDLKPWRRDMWCIAFVAPTSAWSRTAACPRRQSADLDEAVAAVFNKFLCVNRIR
jgi:hypothetical protein